MFNEIMRMASDNGLKQMDILEQIAINAGNNPTNGYKIRRFETFLRPDGILSGAIRVDASQGQIVVTNRDLDIAIKGSGYIPITQPDGQVAYTRDGSLAKNSEGYLVNRAGDLIGNGIKLPLYYDNIVIQKDGTVQVKNKGKLDPETIGKIDLVTFANPEGLKDTGNNKLAPTPTSGPPQKALETENEIRQGTLEHSNVDIYSQVDQMLRLNAVFISNLRIVKFADDLYRQSVNLRQ